MFLSKAAPTGALAGVFEHDGETGYLYLCKNSSVKPAILCAIHVLDGSPDFDEQDVSIRWSGDVVVALFIRGEMWAGIQSQECQGFGGNYRPGRAPPVPANLRDKKWE
jgi:hypothetical protein